MRKIHMLELNKNHRSTQVIKHTARIADNSFNIVELDLVVAKWITDQDLKKHYQEQLAQDKAFKDLYVRSVKEEKIPTVKYKDGFLYLRKRSNWKLEIPEGFNINGKTASEYLINEAHVNTGHGGLDKIYQELTQHYT